MAVDTGEIIQIVDEDHHWFPCLVIVSEPKSFGCQGYVLIPHNDKSPTGQAYIRLNHDDYVSVGRAEITAGE